MLNNNDLNPLTVFKFCPGCGSDQFNIDTEKSLTCAACGFTFFINMNAAVAAVIRDESGKILFTERKHEPAAGLLDLPGGFVDLGETAEDALKREIIEELNLEIISSTYLRTFINKYIYKHVEYQTLDLVFECKVKSFEGIEANDDVSNFKFLFPYQIGESEVGLSSIKSIVEYLKTKSA